MRVSYNWLQTHFEEKLPSIERLAEGLIFHAFEVESIEKCGNDHVLDIKILPDRAHDCLCHFGVAREISAIFDLTEAKIPENKRINVENSKPSIKIEVEDSHLCRRYIGRVIRNIEIGDSGKETKELSGVIGQRPINSVVDAANFVMFEIGQPLHAFDLDKIKGDIKIRNAKTGEKIITLDDKNIDMEEDILVIADDLGPLAIAGIKGGKRASVDHTTNNVLLESANFDPVSIRRSSKKLGLHTDASKRFENEISPCVALRAMELFTEMVLENTSTDKTICEEAVDVYPHPVKEKILKIKKEEIANILGIEIKDKDIIHILKKLGFAPEKDGEELKLIVPRERLDINISEDLVEEVGRIYGYDKLPAKMPGKMSPSGEDKNYLAGNLIRSVLKNEGFSEIYGYTFGAKGEVEVAKSLASDKAFLRSNLTDFFIEKIGSNLKSEIFENDPVKIFELGTIFKNGGEKIKLAVGSGYRTKKLNKSKEDVERVIDKIKNNLGIVGDLENFIENSSDTYTVFELDFGEIVEKSRDNIKFDAGDILNKDAKYKKISQFPRIMRDVALFVPVETKEEEIVKTIIKNAGKLLAGEPILFDVFVKKDEAGKPVKKSLAFRLIFQSYEKTLSDEEANGFMDDITASLEKNREWQVR